MRRAERKGGQVSERADFGGGQIVREDRMKGSFHEKNSEGPGICTIRPLASI